MKIAAVFDYTEKAGGGFVQAQAALRQLARVSERGGHSLVVVTNDRSNVESLQRLGFGTTVFTKRLSDRWCIWCGDTGPTRAVQNRLRFVGAFETELIKAGVDLVYFLSPSSLALGLQRLNYVFTVWDLCHLDAPEFPEVREFGTFGFRQQLYARAVPAAALVVADSETTGRKLVDRYAGDLARILPMPFSPSEFLFGDGLPRSEVLAHYGLTEGYLFYPAQFWPHKNHRALLEALAILRERGARPRLVLVGNDHGALNAVRTFIADRLEGQVALLGFVPREHMRALYEGCSAVVMPSYFGPTNIPPLDAWAMGKPLIYTRDFAEQAGKAALLVDPDDHHALADAVEEIQKPEVASTLVHNGRARLAEITREREQAEAVLAAKLDGFAVRRRCWS